MSEYLDEESIYGDDELDSLPPDTLIDLENDAIQYTQAQLKADPTLDYSDDPEGEELEHDTIILEEPTKIPSFQRNSVALANPKEPERVVIAYSASRPKSGLSIRLNNSCNTSIEPEKESSNDDSLATQVEDDLSPTIITKITSLLKQVEGLKNERDALKQDLTSKTGEIAIVRGKQEKTVKEYEQRILALQKIHLENLDKQQKALDIAQRSERHATTDRDFIKRDLAEESERVRRLNREREREKEYSSARATTPKKRKNLPHGDGFNDDEIRPPSPSKYSPSKNQKRLAGSPSASRRQRRKVTGSLAGALDTSAPQKTVLYEKVHCSKLPCDITHVNLPIRNTKLDFIGTILDHRIDKNHLRTIQEFGKYALPSTPHETLQTLVISKIPDLSRGRASRDLAVGFCEFLITIWTKCMEQEYLKPIHLVIDLLTMALELKTSSLAPHLVDSLLPLAQRTADLIAIPRFQSQSTDKYDKDIDLSACMSLLYMVALGCMAKDQYIKRFWRLMRWDFVLLMLSTNQFQADYDLILRLVSTSVMKDNFGALPGGEQQQLQAGWIIDRLTYPLTEHPFVPMSTKKFDFYFLRNMRLKILQLLIRITDSVYAYRALAAHPHAIGRLVCLISDEIDELYDFFSENNHSAQIINTAMRLLYHLVTKHQNALDVQRNLTNIHGGPQKYLLCLSRLNFLEDDLVIESGIDPDISGYALELLELIVTPEEGDAIQTAFSAH